MGLRGRSGRPIDELDRSDEGRGRVALVTGASAGIGQSLAALLAAKGYDVVPVARRGDRLAALKDRLESRWGVAVDPLVADLQAAGAPGEIADELARRGTRVDFLVNCAGYNLLGTFADIAWEVEEGFLRLQGVAPIELTHRLLPGMLERGWGRIINVTSVTGYQAGSPGMVTYSAVKSMVTKFTEGLAAEVEAQGVTCTASLPGATATEIFEASGVAQFIEDSRFFQLAMMSPNTVARQAYDANRRGDRLVVHGIRNKLWGASMVYLPRRVRYKVAAYMAEFQPEAPTGGTEASKSGQLMSTIQGHDPYRRGAPMSQVNVQEIADRLEIHDLQGRYARTLDSFDWVGLESVFTDDAPLDYAQSQGPVDTAPAVIKWMSDTVPKMFSVCLHYITNSQLKITGDTAEDRPAFYCVLRLRSGHSMVIGGYYRDTYRRTEDGWRISSRTEEVAFNEGPYETKPGAEIPWDG